MAGVNARSGRASCTSGIVAGATVAAATAALASACSLAFPANGTQCTTTSDCTSRGGAFLGSVCVNNVCSIADAAPSTDAPHDVTLEAARDGRSEAQVDSRADVRADGTVDSAPPPDSTTDAPPPNDWKCVGHVEWPDASAQKVTLTVPYINVLDSTPLPGVRVTPCLTLDPGCADPLADAAVTNEAGIVKFSVNSGYDGFLLSEWEAGLPSLVYLDPPIFQSMVVPPEYFLPKAAMQPLLSAVPTADGGTVTVDPTKCMLFLGAYDCDNKPAAGVSFSLSPASSSAVLFYLIDSTPSPTATSTDAFGSAAIANVPVGTVTLTARFATTQELIGTASGYCQANRITYLSLIPTPTP
jgi:hypothetical protein